MMNQWYGQSSFPFNSNLTVVIIIVALWTLFWKGCALWIAAKNHKKGWFLALLIFNTAGILEIIYIFGVAKKKWKDIEEIFSKKIS
jgi:hypothetical protein